MTVKFEGTSAITTSSRGLFVRPQGEEYYNPSNDNLSPSADADDSSILFLFGIFVFVFGMALLRLYCFELPRIRRRSISSQAQRREFIRNTLLKKTVLKGSKVSKPDIENNATLPDEKPTTMEQDHSVITSEEGKINKKTEVETPELRRQKTNLVLSDDDSEETTLSCPICLSDYQENDTICWSNNPLCTHTFHIECIEPWLMKHVKCPCCRHEYLIKEHEQQAEVFVAEEQTNAAAVAENIDSVPFVTANENVFFLAYLRKLAEIFRRGRIGSSSVDEPSMTSQTESEVVPATSNSGVETNTSITCSGGTATREGDIMDDDLENAMSSRNVTAMGSS